MAAEEAGRGNRPSEVRHEANETVEEAKQSDDAPGESLLRKRLGPFTILRGRRSHGNDSGFASIVESRGGELWRMPAVAEIPWIRRMSISPKPISTMPRFILRSTVNVLTPYPTAKSAFVVPHPGLNVLSTQQQYLAGLTGLRRSRET